MIIKKALVAAVAVAATFVSGVTAAAEATQARRVDACASIDGLVQQKMADGGMVGVGAAIIVNRQIVCTRGYGFAKKENATPFTADTVMNIGSISKTFTGVALMRAVQDGKLSLDEDINAYLPFKVVNPHQPGEAITLRQLATHTSGITDRQSVYEGTYRFGNGTPEALGEFLESYFTLAGRHYSADNFLKTRPGTHREYSNIGAGLAGYIVERAVGEKLNTYARRHIFAPLGMGNSGWLLSEIPPGKHAQLYVAQGLRIPIPNYELTTYPDGGVRTSVSDLARFFIALLNEGEYAGARILDRTTAEQMLRFQYTGANKPVNVNTSGEDSVNSGIFWATKLDATRIGHNGSDPGVRTMMLSDLDKEVGVILFTNTSFSDEESGPYFDIFDALWAQAEKVKGQESLAAGR